MADKFLRFPAVKEITGCSRSEIYRRIALGTFPKPVKLSDAGRAVAFLESEIAQWQRERIEKRDDAQAA